MASKHQEELDKFIVAYQKVYGKKPKIEINGGWYKVNGEKSVRLADIEKMTRSLVHTKPKTESAATTAKAETTAKAKPAAKAETTAKAKPAAKAETTAKAKPAAKAETTAKAKPAAKAETIAKAKPAAKAETTAKAKPAAKSGAHSKGKVAPRSRKKTSSSNEVRSQRLPSMTPAPLPSNVKVVKKGDGQRPATLWISKLSQQDKLPRSYQ
ncbi:MAG: hypothetical protein ISP86_05895 [Shewanellaceae bacterium]|nr:hypothetical protein [Shewanellaceae bacterium]